MALLRSKRTFRGTSVIDRFRPDLECSSLRRFVAWSAHLYTALGLVLAAGMAVCIARGGANDFRWAFTLMVIACLVDSTDGSLARRLHVKEVLPQFDGAKLDDLIDFLTFVSLPLALVWRAELLPAGAQWVLVFALVASAYGFCQIPAKTTDGYFVGFPSYWNIVAFYLYVLEIPAWIAAGLVLTLSVLTFVPSYYMYPSRGGTLSRLTSFLGGVWVVLLVWILWSLKANESLPGLPAPVQNHSLALVSLFYPVYYMVASWGISVHRWKRSYAAHKK
jgi:phosphatidylcholine synthase